MVSRGFSNDASKNVYVHSYNDVTWTEADYPVGNRTKNLPNGKTSITTSTTGAVKFGGTWSKTFLNEGDITSLVQADKNRNGNSHNETSETIFPLTICAVLCGFWYTSP